MWHDDNFHCFYPTYRYPARHVNRFNGKKRKRSSSKKFRGGVTPWRTPYRTSKHFSSMRQYYRNYWFSTIFKPRKGPLVNNCSYFWKCMVIVIGNVRHWVFSQLLVSLSISNPLRLNNTMQSPYSKSSYVRCTWLSNHTSIRQVSRGRNLFEDEMMRSSVLSKSFIYDVTVVLWID